MGIEDKDIDLHIDRETLLQEYIPKADYENRLKADLKAILVELQLEIEEFEVEKENVEIRAGECCMRGACIDLIQQKINALKGANNE